MNFFISLDLPILLKIAGTFLLGMLTGYQFRNKRIIIRDYERGLLYKGGKFRRVLLPGSYNIKFGIRRVQIIDKRQDNYLVSQNILTLDNIHVGINVTVRTKVKDAHKAFISSQNFQQDTHDITRSVVKISGRKTKMKTLLNNEQRFEQRMRNRLRPKLDVIGMELVEVELIDVKIPHSIQESMEGAIDDLFAKKDKNKKVGF